MGVCPPFDLRSEPRAAFGFLQHDVRGEYRRVTLRALAFERKPEAPPRNAATGQASMGPIRLSDSQLAAVFDAARPLAVRDRDAFLLDLAAALQAITDPGDGDVARAIRQVQRKHFDPPQFDERSEPHRRAARAL
jgi:hypothetical protein